MAPLWSARKISRFGVVEKKLVIGVHPNENTMRTPNPNVPFTPEEIADDVAACQAEGASVVHFHGRSATGGPDHSPATYGEIMRRIHARCDILLAPSLANVPGYTLRERVANVADNAADPATKADFLVMEMGCAIMDMWDEKAGGFLTEDRVFVNDTATHRALFDYARTLAMVPWMATFNVSWTRTIAAHLADGAVAGPAIIGIILGGPQFIAAHPASVAGLRAQLDFLPEGRDVEWLVSAYGGDVLAVAAEAITRGGHVSIGVGDYAHPDLGFPSNAELVRLVAELAGELGREVASTDEARQLFGVPAGGAGVTA
jgi:3-keto-5-aminohexanoate cleavage enzyme